jgi:hypothetical protein
MDPPGPTWEDLIEELALEPHELAYQLLQKHSAPSLSTRPTTFTGLVSPKHQQLGEEPPSAPVFLG